ncbi:hypothetical protein CROQUDRAFT_92177 [Cronartium quercuum f. sp. fusiforme G11]|uniref:Uncharacterized protein n=1 Tax=Cronartium quercuum f. sp. fusiforme G11 TaxID=708437 RepID=A0A9P6NMH1_9BASI|nr:hypothetical protein CROQUDRAFT_92177 [Cronartium quercuum f. sp. fusiforme G11]
MLERIFLSFDNLNIHQLIHFCVPISIRRDYLWLLGALLAMVSFILVLLLWNPGNGSLSSSVSLHFSLLFYSTFSSPTLLLPPGS